MWHWDQGRMHYSQYDVLRVVARFVTTHQWGRDDPDLIRNATGLPFPPSDYAPWRNCSRIFKQCLLISEKDGAAVPTPVAQLLAEAGSVTCDEYLHFLVKAATDPSPALSDWKGVSNRRRVRYPLCFSLKYLLAKVVDIDEPVTSPFEVIGAYMDSGFSGSEDCDAFIGLIQKRGDHAHIEKTDGARQARESIKFISQISYLHSDGDNIVISLGPEDAKMVFRDIHPISGPHEPDGDQEIQRLAGLFKDSGDKKLFSYKQTILSDELESGFLEGSKVKKNHLVIERNPRLRGLFFDREKTTVCEACNVDTKARYPWTERILDIHHILPLSSGTQVDSKKGTALENLVAVCPTCHRAIHRFYEGQRPLVWTGRALTP